VSALAFSRPLFPRPIALTWPFATIAWLATAQLATRALLTVAGLLIGLLFVFLAILPRSGVYATFTVLSGSMEPQIRKGSVVMVAPTPPDAIQLGDVISFTSRQPPYPTLSHRVIGFGQADDGARIFKTKGDANLLEDPWEVQYPGMAGKVRLTLPLAGYIMAASTTAAGRTLVGLAVFLSLGWFWLRRVWRPGVAVVPAQMAQPASRLARRRGERRGDLSTIRVAMFCWVLLLLLRRRP